MSFHLVLWYFLLIQLAFWEFGDAISLIPRLFLMEMNEPRYETRRPYFAFRICVVIHTTVIVSRHIHIPIILFWTFFIKICGGNIRFNWSNLQNLSHSNITAVIKMYHPLHQVWKSTSVYNRLPPAIWNVSIISQSVSLVILEVSTISVEFFQEVPCYQHCFSTWPIGAVCLAQSPE